jgi:hypothetical protein
MAALPFSFRIHGKVFSGRFKDFHVGKAYRDVRQIMIKKVPHRMKQFTAKDRELRGKQREIDRLYGKLAAASPLTDAELRRTLTAALDRLAQCEMNTAGTN